MQPRYEKLAPSVDSSFRYEWREDQAFAFKWHLHPEIELTYINNSRGRRFVGDHIGDYGPGDLVLLGSNLPHTWHSTRADESAHAHSAAVVQFSRDFLGPDFFTNPEMKRIGHLLDRAARGLSFPPPLAHHVGEQLQHMRDCRTTQRLVKLLDILDKLSKTDCCEILTSEAFNTAGATREHDRVDRVCRMMNERYLEPLTLVEAAAYAHMTPSSFSRFFKRATGRTFVQYLNELRIARACQLLIESERSVSDICFASGFHNLSNFNRRFIALRAISPRAYRNQYRASG